MRRLFLMILLLASCGCSTYQGVGSEYWHVQRLDEIEAAYKSGKLSEAEYYSLKNESDHIRQEYLLDGTYSRHNLRRANRPYRYR